METLMFSNNWNNKLNCDVFTTIRLRNDKKYYPGAEFEVILKQGAKQTFKGYHYVIAVRNLLLKELDGHTCILDTGYPLQETQELIKTMYSGCTPSINWGRQYLQVIYLKKDKNKNQPTLF